MPTTLTFPGVYVEEIPSGVRPVTGVATSITAFVGRSLRGPVNDPVTINSYGDFQRTFGGLWSESTLSYAVRDFFLNGGSQAVIVRLYDPLYADEPTRAAAYAAAVANATTEANKIAKIVSDNKAKSASDILALVQAEVDGLDPTKPDAVAAGNYMLGAISDSAGSAPSLADILNAATTAASTQATAYDANKAAGQSIVAALTAAADGATLVQLNKAMSDAQNALGSPLEKSAAQAIINSTSGKTTKADMLAVATPAQAALAAANDGLKASVNSLTTKLTNDAVDPAMTPDGLVTDAQGVAAAASGDAKGALLTVVAAMAARRAQPPSGDTLLAAANAAKGAANSAGGDAVAPRAQAVLNVNGLELTASQPGSWGNLLRARITLDVPGGNSKQFNLAVYDGNTGQIESYLTVSTDPADLRYVANVLQDQSQLVIATAVPAKPIASPAPPMPRDAFSVIVDKGGVKHEYSTGVQPGSMGTDGLPLKESDFTGSEVGKTGIYALENTDLFNILCLPPYDFSRDMDADVITEAISYCERKRAFVIVDPPSGWVTKDLAKAGFGVQPFGTSDHAALFWPPLKLRDPLRDNRVGQFAPCGAVAGIFARTDADRGVWKAPAGFDATLNSVPELAVPLTDAENGELNPLGLNCLRVKPGAGRVVWGSRTLAGDDRLASDYKYISVRRTALFIEESLYRSIQWVVFEPNDEPLWAQIRANIISFMQGLFRQGAFAGATPKDAYIVKCDGETTLPADVNLGIVNIVVGFAPLKPAEFVVLQLQQIAGQQP